MIDRWPRMFPISGHSPGGGDDTLWLNLTVYELERQTLNAREKGGVIKGSAIIDELSFLMPLAFEESMTHNWEEHQGIINRAAEIARTIDMSGREAAGVIKAIHDGATKWSMDELKSGVGSISVSDIKPDTPLIFNGSSRRELVLTISLADQGDNIFDVMEPINRLREYSAPAHGGDMFKIKFPHVFELKTVTGTNKTVSVFTVRTAVLRSIQPSFEGPYRQGYPSKCELTLSFTDMETLYRDTLYRPSKVTATMRNQMPEEDDYKDYIGF